MKKALLLLIPLMIFISCEDEKEDEDVSAFVGTWDLTFAGEYENADCTGDLDSTLWAFAQAFGMTATMTLNDDGTAEMTVSVMGETETETGTWSENSDGTSLTINGESQNVSMASDGNSFSVTAMDDAYCEDSDGEETSYTDSTSCQAAGNYWIEASCSYMEYTKE
jgi:hypothetical protein